MNSWKIFVLLFGLLVVPAWAQDAGKPATVQNLGFNFASPKSKLEITFDQEVTFEKSLSEADKQIIIDVPNAKIGKKWSRRIDASQFKSNVAMISPYQSENRVRITLQLKENGGVEISQDGKTITAMIDNKQPTEKSADMSKDLNDTEKQAAAPDAAKDEVPAAGASGMSGDAAAAGAGGDSLESFFKAQETKVYSGRHITLQAQDRDLSEVFQLISDASEFNILLSDNVKGKVVLNMNDVPWDQALDIILHSYRLAAERQGNVLRITTLAALTAEREAESQSKKVVEAAEPLVVKIFPISYAKVDDLKTIIRDFMTKDTAATGAFGLGGFGPPPGVPATPLPGGLPGGLPGASALTGGLAGNTNQLRGTITIDARTNALIIRDTPTKMETIKRIIKELDTATPQILIEGKFVEVSQSNSDSVSGRLFVTNRESDPTTGALTFPTSNNNFGAAFNTAGPEVFSPTTSFLGNDGAGSGGAGFGFMPKVGLLPGLGEIGAFISLLQSESSARVIASPRIVTQNKEDANITSGQNIFVGGAGGNAGGSTGSSIPVLLTLDVVPQVTNDGSVLMKIKFSQDTIGNGPVGSITTNSKSIATSVVVDSGGTVVIGGVYSSTSGVQESGLPILRNLPIIGPFFGTKIKQELKDELFIFITPRVLNEKESGIKG